MSAYRSGAMLGRVAAHTSTLRPNLRMLRAVTARAPVAAHTAPVLPTPRCFATPVGTRAFSVWKPASARVWGCQAAPTVAATGSDSGVSPSAAIGARRLASKKAGRRRAQRMKQAGGGAGAGRGGGAGSSKFKMRAKQGDPKLHEVMRQFVKRVHPDLFGAHPELRETNEASLQVLNGFLTDIKSGGDEFPERRSERIYFFVRTPEKGNFLRVAFDIRTTGADCRHLVAESFAKLFRTVGLPDRFHWGEEYWGRATVAPNYVSKGEYNEHKAARSEYERQGRA